MNIPLSTIILGELLLVLLMLIAFLVRHLVHQKKIITKLLEKIRSTAGTNLGENFYKSRTTSSPPSIADYFIYSLNDALTRFKKFTDSDQPILNKEHSFSGKIAALRHLYLSAEQEVFAERGITHAGWGTIERRLAEIVQWSDQSNSQYEKIISDLQRQIGAAANETKKHQAKNSHLLKRLENLRNEQHSLEHLNTKNSALIDHLQDALLKLKNINPQIDEGKSSFSLPFDNHYIDNFGEKNSDENHNLRALLNEIKNTPSTAFNRAQQKRIENQINLLEIELLKSDRHVNNLKQQLKDAKLQITNYALMKKDNSPIGDIESLYSNLMKKVSPDDQDDPDTIIAEIKNLQGSNKIQHTTISSLETEISTLKNSINTDDSDDVNKEKEKEILRLERLVKECQGCIVILEEEVDNLYARLQEQASALKELPDTIPTEETNTLSDLKEIDFLVQELQKTATNYQHLYAINTLLIDFFQCHDFEKLTSLLLNFIKNFNLPVGLYIKCIAGKMEYAPEHFFNAQHRDQLKSLDAQESLIYLDGGTLFNYSNIRAMTLTDNQEQLPMILDNNFQMVVAATNERLNDLIYYLQAAEKEQDDVVVALQVKDMLNNLNIRYAFQIDENRKTFDHFLSELKRAYGLLELKGSGAVILDNAVNEFEMRMSLLLESGEAIDKEISVLVEKMESV